jgi:hypothetical protein
VHPIELPEKEITRLVLLAGATDLYDAVFHSAQLDDVSQGEGVALTAMPSAIMFDYDVGVSIHRASLIGVAITLENVLRGSFRRLQEEGCIEEGLTLIVAIVSKRDGGEEVKGIIGEHSPFDLIVGEQQCLCFCVKGRGTVPIAENLAWALYLEVLLGVLGSLVVEEPVGVLLPRQDLELQTE